MRAETPDEKRAQKLGEMDAQTQKEFWAMLALRHCPGLGAKSRARLLNHFPSAAEALERREQWAKLGIPEKCRAFIGAGAWRKGAAQEWSAAARRGCGLLLRNDPLFPQSLRDLSDGPLFLYYEGDLNLLKAPLVAIVGSRQASERSLKVAASLAEALSACGIAVVSGMAVGIDAAAHRAALKEVGRSVGVLGTGIDVQYPSGNRSLYAAMRENGLLLTEFAPESPPVPHNFPVRNRVISGLSLGVAVIEAAEKSGSLVTARHALEQNREVFAVPGAALSGESQGCNNLIRQGAHPVFCVEDILNNLSCALRPYQVIKNPKILIEPELKASQIVKKAEPSEIEPLDGAAQEIAAKQTDGDNSRAILECLLSCGPLAIDAISDKCGLESGQISSLLIFMEMLGQVRRLAGAKYEAMRQ